jgi:hypothetical protein
MGSVIRFEKRTAKRRPKNGDDEESGDLFGDPQALAREIARVKAAIAKRQREAPSSTGASTSKSTKSAKVLSLRQHRLRKLLELGGKIVSVAPRSQRPPPKA